MNEDKDITIFQMWVYGLAVLVGLLVLFVVVSGDGGDNKTDGVFESAAEKLDKGQPLNDRERKRIDDIINFHKK